MAAAALPTPGISRRSGSESRTPGAWGAGDQFNATPLCRDASVRWVYRALGLRPRVLCRFVWDPSFFNTLPNGVDATLFKPMEKMVAKREIAEAVGDDRIEKVPTVGYLSRVQSEKGHPST